MAYGGHKWRTAATNGVRRPQMAYGGHKWRTAATNGVRRPQKAADGGHKWPTPGHDIDAREHRVHIYSDMRFQICESYDFILIVEKDTAFDVLCQAKLWEELPCVLITGRGIPDAATRCLVADI